MAMASHQVLKLLKVSDEKLTSLIQTIVVNDDVETVVQNLRILHEVLQYETHSDGWLEASANTIFTNFCVPLLVKIGDLQASTKEDVFSSLASLAQACMLLSNACKYKMLDLCMESLQRSSPILTAPDAGSRQCWRLRQENLPDMCSLEADVAVQLMPVLISALKEGEPASSTTALVVGDKLEAIFHVLLKLLVFEQSAQVLAYNSVTVIKGILLLLVDRRESLIKTFWDNIRTLCSEGKQLPKALGLLASTCEAFVLTAIAKDHNLWLLIQDGLIYSDPLARKQALFILKCSLEYISSLDTFATTFHYGKAIAEWNKVDDQLLWGIWKPLILLMETLEEKQVHLISPLLGSIGALLEASHGYLHQSWLYTLLSRICLHDAKTLSKWGVEYCLTSGPLIDLSIRDEVGRLWITQKLLPVLGEAHLYARDESEPSGSELRLLSLLKAFLIACHERLESSDERRWFGNKILDMVCDLKSSHVSLFYLTRAISQVPMPDCWGELQLASLRKFLHANCATIPCQLRLGIFCNLCWAFFHNTPAASVSYESVLDFVVFAVNSDLLHVHSDLWWLWQSWILRFDVDSENHPLTDVRQPWKLSYERWLILNTRTFEFIESSFERGILVDSSLGTEIAVRILLYSSFGNDVGHFEFGRHESFVKEKISTLLSPLTDFSIKLNSNPYLNWEKAFSALNVLSTIVDLVLRSSERPLLDWDSGSHVLALALDCLLQCCTHIQSFLGRILRATCLPCSTDVVDAACRLHEALSKLIFANRDRWLPKFELTRIFHRDVLDYVIAQCRTFSTDHACEPSLSLWKICASVSRSMSRSDDGLLHALLSAVVRFHGKQVALGGSLSAQESKIKLLHVWQSIAALFSKSNVSIGASLPNATLRDAPVLLDALCGSLDVVASDGVAVLIDSAFYILPILHQRSRELVRRLFDVVWNVLAEQKMNDNHFTAVFASGIRVFFNETSLLHQGTQWYGDLLTGLFSKIMDVGERKAGIMNLLVDQILSVCRSASARFLVSKDESVCPLGTLCFFKQELVKGLVFGSLYRKHMTSSDDAVEYIQLASDLSHVPKVPSVRQKDQFVRISLINFILELEMKTDWELTFLGELLRELVAYEVLVSVGKKCYFPNSLRHRQKIRIWQAILVIIDKLPDTYDCADLLQKFYMAAVMDNQPSVRYLIEWAMTLLFCKYPPRLPDLWGFLGRATEKKLYSVTSVFGVIIHLALTLTDSEFPAFAEKAIVSVLPWTLAQHMTSRLHAQVALRRLLDQTKLRNLPAVELRYSLLEHCFELNEINSSAIKHRQEKLENFCFTQFHPLKHYSLESIFSGFLSHTEVFSDEFVDVTAFRLDSSDHVADVRLSLYNKDGMKIHDNALAKKLEQGLLLSAPELGLQLVDFQKKVTPCALTVPAEDSFLQSAYLHKKETSDEKLILCATLLEKIPNLGGLCRTCEIFGVSTFVLGSYKYLADPLFKSLSVTSEKWQDVEQVLPVKLAEYLISKKRCGYRLVGVEQTANSVPVDQYRFREKTVLLLGNEREGIPVNFIQLLDDCVQIPQQGVIRSLNVHVSGAIIVWEYFRQHRQHPSAESCFTNE